MASFIARAAMSISGTKISLFLNFSPTAAIAGTSAWSTRSPGLAPSLSARCVRARASLFLPAATAWESCASVVIMGVALKKGIVA